MTKQLSWCNINIFGFQLLSHLERYHFFTFNFATMFHQYLTTFTFPLLKSISKPLFIMQHIVIPLSFTFKSPDFHKYASASSLSKSSKFLILQFLVKCCKLHSVFKILSKSHMLKIFLSSSAYYVVSDNQLWKKLNLCLLLQANKNIPCKNQIRIQNMCQQFSYEQLPISAKTAKIKLLKF